MTLTAFPHWCRRRLARGAQLLPGALWALGCAGSATSDGDPGESGVSGNVEIFSWWTSPGEADALEELLQLYRTEHPRATVTNAAVEYADKAREQLALRMAEGLPPDTFQANVGADLLERWVLTNTNDDSEAKVENLQWILADTDWLDEVYPELLDAASYDGKLRAVPVNVHRINSLVVRKDLFEKYDLEVPTSMDELYELCELIVNHSDIQAEAPAGDRMACLGLGNKYNWTLSQLTFEMILPALAGPSYYEQFWTGEKSGDDPEIIAALEAVLRLYCGGDDTSDCLATGYFNADVNDIDWDKGVLKVAEKRAMMAAMGDWAKGFLEVQDLEAGVDFDIAPFPGSEGTFVYTSDTFPLPKGAPNRRGALELLKTFAAREGQVAFNKVKGSIPVRHDIDPLEFDAVTQTTIQEFVEARKVLALSGLLAGDLMPSLGSELKASLRWGSIEIIQNYVRANYATIRR